MKLYEQVLKIVTPYFGNVVTAAAFLSRQCARHLDHKPAEMCPHDLWYLAYWVSITASSRVGNENAAEMGDKIRALRRAMGAIPMHTKGDFRQFKN